MSQLDFAQGAFSGPSRISYSFYVIYIWNYADPTYVIA